MKSKKLLSLLLALAMVMSMAACGAKTNEPPATSGTPSETGARRFRYHRHERFSGG